MFSTKSIIKAHKQESLPEENTWLLKESPGGFQTPKKRHWRMGQWCAKTHEICFVQNEVTIWSSTYSAIRNLNFEETPYAFGVKRSLEIRFGEELSSKVWLLTADLEAWEKLLRVRVFPIPLTEEQVATVASQLDHASEQILWYFWEHGCASISEIARLGLSGDPLLLLKMIKETINPKAIELIGFPLLFFREKEMDPDTLQEIHNCWWLIDPVRDVARRCSMR